MAANIIIKSEERKQETARTLAEYGIDYHQATSEQKEMAEQYNADYRPFAREFKRMEEMR